MPAAGQREYLRQLRKTSGRLVRYLWSDYRLPITDVVRGHGAARDAVVGAALLMGMMAAEFIETGEQAVPFLTESGILPVITVF